MTMTVSELAAALNGKPSGGGWVAHCPAHEDAHPSLSISEASGKILFRCHAGCTQGDIIAALQARGLWNGNGNGSGRRELVRYDYRDAGGKVLYQVVRFEPKDFRQFNPATGECSIKDIQRVPYRLPELLAAISLGADIWIAEGEKDVEALVSLGIIATCNAGGCGSSHAWKSFARYFPAGTRVVLCPDADEPGQKLMQEVANYLAGVGCQIQEAKLGYPITKTHGKDISDWLGERKARDSGPGAFPEGDETETIRHELEALVGAKIDQSATPGKVRGFHFIRASELEINKPEHVDPDKKIEKDTNCSAFGESQAGKTSWAIDVNCKVAALGETCFYIVGEGQRGFKRRLLAWCAEYGYKLDDLPLYVSMVAAPMNDEDYVGQVIEAMAQENGAPALVTIDSLARNLDGDENSPVDMGAFIRGIDRIRAEFHCATLTIHHSGHLAKERSRGHSSWKAALDTEYRFDKDEAGTIRMICTKSKDSVPPEPCAFELKQVPIGIVDDDGRDVFSVVLVPAEYEPEQAPGKAGRGRWQTEAQRVLEDLQVRYRENLDTDGRDPDTARIPADDWREACLAAGMPRKRFYAVKETLVDMGKVTLDHGFVLPCPVVPFTKVKGDKRDTSAKDQRDKRDTNRTTRPFGHQGKTGTLQGRGNVPKDRG